MSISGVTARAYKIPTDRAEADGTLEWDATVMVVVTVQDGEHTGLGFTYAAAAVASLVTDHLAPVVSGADTAEIPRLAEDMARAVRNLGHVEYFHDHHRIETSLFDGTLPPRGGVMTPDLEAVGHGLTFRQADAERYRVA